MKRRIVGDSNINNIGDVTFDNLDQYQDNVWVMKRNNKRYMLVGKFVGYDGVPYVALITLGTFKDRSYLNFNSFIKNYSIYTGQVDDVHHPTFHNGEGNKYISREEIDKTFPRANRR